MRVKTAELIGPALDWAVALCEGFGPDTYMKNIDLRYDVSGKVSCIRVPINREYTVWGPSTKWYQAGPIIEREKIELVPSVDGKYWYAESLDRKARTEMQPTPLIAAMRCYVASKLGDEIALPEHLISGAALSLLP